ncbi:MAG: arginine--tRNA ligase [Candidatus Omnitrophica bacterium]|nr:arginine--tRNA ligase [Candidatus Omnitrophota bacterium]
MKDALRDTLQQVLEKYTHKKGVSLPKDFEIELIPSKDPSHGDLSTPLAFKLAKLVKEKPAQVADDLVLFLEKEVEGGKGKLVERCEVAGQGFINFFLPAARLTEALVEIHKKDSHFGKSDFGKGKKVLIEFVSANPTGPLTIAHGRQAAVGDSIARILQATGHEINTEYYLNDAGRQMNLLGASLWARYKEALGTPTPLPEEGYQGEYLKDIAARLIQAKKESLLKEKAEKAIDFCRQFAASEIMEGIKKDLADMRVAFDHYFKESSLYEKASVERALHFLKDCNFLYESEGALWFRSTAFGDDKDRVVKKSSGEYTYLAPDIAYHRYKFERGFNWLINLWGPDHHGYILRLKAACQALGHDPKEVDIRIVQLTTLYRKGEPVRMSTRAGEFVTLRELIDEVGVDATRFFFLLRRIESHLDFDLDLAKEQSDENPVYYLQYAYARISSILDFAKKKVDSHCNLERLGEAEELDLIKKLQEYPDVLIQSAQALEPYRVVDYLRELAAQFHKFYALHRVVTEDEELTKARLLLVDGVRIVLRNGLTTLGVSHPEKM